MYPRKVLIGHFMINDQGKTKKKTGGRRTEGHVTHLWDKRVEDTSRKQRRTESSSDEVQSPEGLWRLSIVGYSPNVTVYISVRPFFVDVTFLRSNF